MPVERPFERYFQLARRNWKLLSAVAVSAIALTWIFSGPTFIKPRFVSRAVVYPVNLTSYSIETRTDQLLQLLESNSIRDSIIARFDLANHYDMKPGAPGARFFLYNEFNERVTIGKTRFESVEIEVVDESPDTAQAIVSGMLEQVNLLARRLQREKSQEVLKIAMRSLDNEREKLDTVEAKLQIMRERSGLLEYESQTQELTKGYVRLLTRGGGDRTKVEAMLAELGKSGGEFRELTELSDLFRANYDRLLSEYERAVNDVTKELTYVNVVVHPEVPDKKVYPIRWLIVSIGTCSAVLLAFVLLLMRKPD
ncbi:MAG: hypothetical protein ABI599_11020 [Flavobacteriales bacterium]